MPVKSNEMSTRVTIPVDLSDAAEDRFLEQTKRAIKTDPPKISLDCSKLKWVTSRHINLIWQAHKIGGDAGIEVKLINTTERLIRVLKILDIYDLLPCDTAGSTQRICLNNIPEHVPVEGGWEITFLPGIDDINLAQTRLDKFLEDLDVSDLIRFEIETIFYEIATNIRLHSNIASEEKVIMQCRPTPEKFMAEMRYHGDQFDPMQTVVQSDAESSAKMRRKRGYGLLMINRMTDKISYERDHNDVNVLKFEKYWR